MWLATPTILPSVNLNNFCIELYYFVQAAVSVIRHSEVVRYSGAATVLRIWRVQLVHVYAVSVIAWVEVCHWECLLIESQLYIYMIIEPHNQSCESTYIYI